MQNRSQTHQADQTTKFAGYKSLDLVNKIYQLKAISLISRDWTPRKNSKVLELGCADGSFISHITQKCGGAPFGLDISPVSVRLAEKNHVKAKVHDLSKRLPFSDNSFDLVIALEVIEHLFDTDFFISEIKRVTKKKGLIVISTPNLASISNRFKLLFGHYPKYLEYSTRGAGHIHLYTLPVLIHQFSNLKLKIRQATSPNFFCPFITKSWFPPLFKNIAIFLGDIFPSLGSHLLLVAQK